MSWPKVTQVGRHAFDVMICFSSLDSLTFKWAVIEQHSHICTYSTLGIRVLTLERLIVPEKGTVGASGDLSPLSHLALGYMGEELMTSPMYPYPTSAATVLAHHFLVPIELHAKEGLALINGTQLIGSLAAETIVRSKNLLQCADVAVAFSLEVLKGTVNAFHPQIHQVRPHAGQNLVAQRVRTLLQYEDKPSE